MYIKTQHRIADNCAHTVTVREVEDLTFSHVTIRFEDKLEEKEQNRHKRSDTTYGGQRRQRNRRMNGVRLMNVMQS